MGEQELDSGPVFSSRKAQNEQGCCRKCLIIYDIGGRLFRHKTCVGSIEGALWKRSLKA
jgi:hypothetical protein